MLKENLIWIASNENPIYVHPSMLNRHGLITGATGTGKTVTLKVFAESISALGVPVFLADIKGDLAGLSKKGEMNSNLQKRLPRFNLENLDFDSFPVTFYDIYGKKGLPVKITISDLGPVLISRLLDLNQTQSQILNMVFKIADDQGLLLIDLKDLRSMINYVTEHASEYKMTYGAMSSQSLTAILRALIRFEDEGGDLFFGEPALDLGDFFELDEKGYGMINILDATELYMHPLLYSTFLLWMLSSLYEQLREVGDLDKPKFVFFFDEAHLLFEGAPKALVEQVEQIVRLIRSKGVGIFFISQKCNDIPEDILAQLGNKVQHALRAYTPKEQQNIKATAKSFRPNPAIKIEEAIQELGTGEALVSFLNDEGVPSIVERAYITPPLSSFSAINEYEYNMHIHNSPLYSKYCEEVDRYSAYEQLEEVTKQEAKAKEEAAIEKEKAKQAQKVSKEIERAKTRVVKKVVKSTVRGGIKSATKKSKDSLGATIGKEIFRGLFGVKL